MTAASEQHAGQFANAWVAPVWAARQMALGADPTGVTLFGVEFGHFCLRFAYFSTSWQNATSWTSVPEFRALFACHVTKRMLRIV
jgi:hypothetical protein